MAQAEDNTQMEMELMLKEQVDPVSGNTAPLGSTPEEVRDDVPINASVGEFMINAQTVNYFGEEFFTNLQETAAEGWQRIKEGEESFFRDDELEVDEVDDMPTDEVQSMAYGGKVRGYAKGGSLDLSEKEYQMTQAVGGGYTGAGGTGEVYTGFEQKSYINPDTKQRIIIFFFNGRPLSRVPEGYREVGATEVEEQKKQQVEQDSRDDDPTPTTMPKPQAKPVDLTNMTGQDLLARAKTLSGTSKLVEVLSGAVGGLPAMALLGTQSRSAYNDVVEEMDRKNVSHNLERKGSIFGGESGLLTNLKDTSDDNKVSFADTWLGDLIGVDGAAGVQGPGLKESFGGARRDQTAVFTESDSVSSADNGTSTSRIGTDAGDGMTWVKGKNTNALVRVRNDDPDLANRIADSKGLGEFDGPEDDDMYN